MSHRDRDNHTARNLALLGSTALLFWLLVRGKGWGWGLGAGGDVGLGGGGAGSNVAPTNSEAAAPCRVWIRGDHIDLDGTPTDLPTVVSRCRTSGRAVVNATGDAIVRTIGDVVRAIQAAGVVVSATPDVWSDVWVTAGVPQTRTP